MSNYPPNWDSIRKQIYRRDNYTCQECGDTDVELHAHHKNPISQGGGHEKSNLTTLCKSCHGEVHGRKFPSSEPIELFPNQRNLLLGSIYFLIISLVIPPFAVIFAPLGIAGILIYLGKEND